MFWSQPYSYRRAYSIDFLSHVTIHFISNQCRRLQAPWFVSLKFRANIWQISNADLNSNPLIHSWIMSICLSEEKKTIQPFNDRFLVHLLFVWSLCLVEISSIHFMRFMRTEMKMYARCCSELVSWHINKDVTCCYHSSFLLAYTKTHRTVRLIVHVAWASVQRHTFFMWIYHHNKANLTRFHKKKKKWFSLRLWICHLTSGTGNKMSCVESTQFQFLLTFYFWLHNVKKIHVYEILHICIIHTCMLLFFDSVRQDL